MRQAAANRPAIANSEMRDKFHRLMQHWQVFDHDARCLQHGVPGQRADLYDISAILDERQPWNAVDIDQHGWP
jgi:hypothetical protein